MINNAVLRLRQQRLELSTKPFRARGCRVVRCQRCLLPAANCLCHTIQPRPARSRFCLVMFDTEPLKPSNTGRLIADILPETQAFLWSRTSPDPQLLAALGDPDYQPYLVFLADDTEEERQIFQQLPSQGKPPLFVLLDGTWPEARKMFRKSPYLDKLPMLSLHVDALSRYQLREASNAGQHCTAEIAIALLGQAGDSIAAQALANHFDRFRKHYLAGKSHHTLRELSPSITA
ncbi:DTW domain-containing protein [Brenneria goodwinii]|uniref:tRNA-uridine aminocarboxypropyltransferase n=1 Tax=Brenneria goodwinii TaxID=1109412 RepID=UPI000EF1959E|nr:tRNA-uridine aminocarboxypropyltransferase [Brenneria goodwinii]MCG8159140.1 DTW domain-containing protein [Brenneria goodwinii]MCG8163017.1 DTW domain-containing protein [Brenneria goodwinii]MCG8168374.1 DTW domain-containing protein [Brenneria goodwinii]MCG8172993.1 DTW domain-containing protein [Brenneria goodwinii]MCG8176970.1 DTW domain-containing protein [Brenneria goodwinii]